MIVVITIAEIMVIIGLVCLFVAYGKQAYHQWRCNHFKHDYWEDRSCSAHCRGCGKNLGFVGTYREERKKYHEQNNGN